MVVGRRDGGTWGFKGDTRDCVTRAIAIAIAKPYKEIYDLINEFAKKERRKNRSHARTGVYKDTIRAVIKHLGWAWKPIMGIGTGCTVHLKASELPPGRIIVSASKHVVAVIDGVVKDTYDSTRNGTRCVYGYWSQQ